MADWRHYKVAHCVFRWIDSGINEVEITRANAFSSDFFIFVFYFIIVKIFELTKALKHRETSFKIWQLPRKMFIFSFLLVLFDFVSSNSLL